jgi:hypothetical protein
LQWAAPVLSASKTNTENTEIAVSRMSSAFAMLHVGAPIPRALSKIHKQLKGT